MIHSRHDRRCCHRHRRGPRFAFRFAPDKGFEGADRSGGAPRTGPVQFERQEEFDPFGIDQFLSKAKQASKRPGEERRDDRDKRRRH